MRKAIQHRPSSTTGIKADATGKTPRKDGRRALLVYLDPALIRDLKKEALDRDINVYELVEEILKKQAPQS